MNFEHDPDLDTQILECINEAWKDACGDLEPLKPSTTLEQVIKSTIDSSDWWDADPVDFMEFNYYLEYRFGIAITQKEWFSFLGAELWNKNRRSEGDEFCRLWTVRHLIEFIRVRLPEVSFDPVNICGKECAPAGAFYGLRDLVQHHLKSDIHMGPSSRIDDIIGRHSLSSFWKHVRLFTRNRTPQLVPRSKYHREIFRFGYYWMLFYEKILSLGLLFAIAGLNWLWLIVPSALANWIHWTILKDPDNGYLPDEIQTFRDLAEYIAKQPAVA